MTLRTRARTPKDDIAKRGRKVTISGAATKEICDAVDLFGKGRSITRSAAVEQLLELGLAQIGPMCEHCGCTESHACAEGCGWDPRFTKVGRAVCTRCSTKVAPPAKGPK